MADSTIVSRLTLLLCLLALAASSVAVASSWRAQRRSAPAAVPGGVPESDGGEVERRVAGLERQVELLRAALAVRSVAAQVKGAPAVVAVAGAPAAEVGDLTQRLSRLEQLAASIQGHGGDRPLPPEVVAGATRTVLDRSASLKDRAAALTLLRPNDGRADGRTHDVVTAALELIQAPDATPKLRAGMIRDLDRLKDPVLKDPLMGILARDQDPRTRREAVETLAVFYDDAAVRAEIERLKDADPEGEVRAQAIKQLDRWHSRHGQ